MSKKEKAKKNPDIDIDIDDNVENSTSEEISDVEIMDTEELFKKNEDLTSENEELKNQVLRQMAEFDNYKRRTQKEKADLSTFVKADCVTTILGVIDNFERALEVECSDENFKKGVDMIFNQFKDNLVTLGVEEIIALNETFDPELHSAVNQIEDENFGENTVCQVFQKGYKIGTKVIRHSMVVVANP